ncbi:hypothetical protein O5282_18405 [Escherichia coli]|nr:hypothetical protein [Escherichia coli]
MVAFDLRWRLDWLIYPQKAQLIGNEPAQNVTLAQSEIFYLLKSKLSQRHVFGFQNFNFVLAVRVIQKCPLLEFKLIAVITTGLKAAPKPVQLICVDYEPVSLKQADGR